MSRRQMLFQILQTRETRLLAFVPMTPPKGRLAVDLLSARHHTKTRERTPALNIP